MLYFAYGSNMCTERLRRRVPSARVHMPARLPDYTLRFHKRSTDGSGKCNIVPAPDSGAAVHGVVFAMDPNDRPRLDRAEGLGSGYERTICTVQSGEGPLTAFAYVAMPDYIDDTLAPYRWYKALVVEGAREHDLPDAYRRMLTRTEAVSDSDTARARRNRDILPVAGRTTDFRSRRKR